MNESHSVSEEFYRESQAPQLFVSDTVYWDSRAFEFRAQASHQHYVEVFLSKCKLRPGDVVFDMGCGAGLLAIPLLEAGHSVIAADFSPAMLDLLYSDMKKRGLSVCSPAEAQYMLQGKGSRGFRDLASKPSISTSDDNLGGSSRVVSNNNANPFSNSDALIRASFNNGQPITCFPIRLAWDDDWRAVGLRENMVDVAIASRSWATQNYQRAITNLSCLAKRRVCVTVADQIFPDVNQEVMEEIGLVCPRPYESDRVMGAVSAEGYHPQSEPIVLTRTESFESVQQAWEKYKLMVEKIASIQRCTHQEIQSAQVNLKEWLRVHLVEATQSNLEPQENAQTSRSESGKKYIIDTPRIHRWACISWDTTK